MVSKKAILIRSSSLDRDTRATKIIRALTENKYNVTILYWDQGFMPARSERYEAGDFNKEIVFKLKTQMGIKNYIALPIWWSFIFYRLMILEYDIIHAIQITSVVPAILAGKLRNKPVIYDMLDVYEDSISIPKIIRHLLIKIDKIFMWLAAAVILSDKCEIKEIDGIPNSNIVEIYDSPYTSHVVDISHNENELLTLFFAGLLIKKKALNLDKIFKAIESVNGVKIIIAGFGDLVDEIKEWEQKMPNKIQFIGEISHAEVIERSAKADILFILRDTTLLVNKYICGSKILEAMMVGNPVIVNKGTSTARIVREENCGLIVDANNIDEIKNAILDLRDNVRLRKELGINARNAYFMRYSWDIMKTRLLNLYQQLLNYK